MREKRFFGQPAARHVLIRRGNNQSADWSVDFRLLSGWRDSNPRPLRPERSALPSCATSRFVPLGYHSILSEVNEGGLLTED